MKRVAVGIAAMLIANALPAQERIRSYDVEVDVRPDASLDVVERITVHAEGQNIRRGIYRDFPTRYQDRYGNRVTAGFEMAGVERDGATEPWFTERQINGIRINTGNDNFLSVPADYTYTLHYRTTRQLGFFTDHDELYWNAIGNGWIFPIEESRVRVRLPSPVPVNQMHAEAYTGPQGAKGSNYTAELPQPGIAVYRLTQPLGSYESFTIVLTFPKGLIPPPTSTDRIKWFLGDNRGVLIALLGLIALLVYCVKEWNRVGRDPQGRAIIARYEPPAGKTPAGLRYLMRMGYDIRCFSADVLALAVAGQLQISREEHFLGDTWSLTRNGEVPFTPTSEGVLVRGLFAFGEDTLELKKTNAAIISAARNAHSKALDREFQPRYFHRNGKSVAIAVLIAIISIVVGGIASAGFGIPAIAAIGALMLIAVAVFARLVRAPTIEGRALLDEIEGLKLYLSVAERQELAQMRGPDEPPVLNAERYEALLPYAVALEVEEAWTNKFTAAVGAAAAAEAASRMTWYGGGGPITNLGDFTHSIGSSLSSQISSSASPPGSGSGSGGGGSSGGGGGGGGGGGR